MVRNILDKILLGVVGGLLFSMGSIGRLYGVRSQEDIYSFEYRGKPAAIVQQDVRWGPDRNFIRFEEGQVMNDGKIITDEGKEISIEGESLFNRYSIRDSKAKKE
jgi:hypothetical protein